MGDRLDQLFADWYALGGAVLLAEMPQASSPRKPEELLAESTAYCRDSGRLTWVVLDWLIQHVADVYETRLLEQTSQIGDLSVLGFLCEAAFARNPDVKLTHISESCPANPQLEPFFHRTAKSPLASRLAAENPLPIFRRWNYLSNEIRYLSDRKDISAATA